MLKFASLPRHRPHVEPYNLTFFQSLDAKAGKYKYETHPDFISYEDEVKDAQTIAHLLKGPLSLQGYVRAAKMTTPWEDSKNDEDDDDDDEVKIIDPEKIDRLYLLRRTLDDANFILLARMCGNVYVHLWATLQYWHICNCYGCDKKKWENPHGVEIPYYIFHTTDPRVFFDLLITVWIPDINSKHQEAIYESFVLDGMRGKKEPIKLYEYSQLSLLLQACYQTIYKKYQSRILHKRILLLPKKIYNNITHFIDLQKVKDAAEHLERKKQMPVLVWNIEAKPAD